MKSERAIVGLVAAVQFVNILEFMVVMPLGPDFARALGFSSAHVGYVGGIYTAAAALAGVAGAFFLDRFDRRKALAVVMLGLVCSTAAGGFATGLPTMLAARFAAGLFGGPAAALSIAVISDIVPIERRGRAMGVVMGTFSLASIAGVPAGLELARLGGWRAPFFAVAALEFLVAALGLFLMPPMRRHLDRTDAVPARPFGEFARDPAVRLALVAMATVTISMFALIPNFSAYFQFNAGFPRERLGLLYFLGGIAALIAVRFAGILADRRGAPFVVAIASAFLIADLVGGFVFEFAWLPTIGVFVLLMAANSARMVAYGSLATRVPPPAERARFLSAQSAVQHAASSVGAGFSAWYLTESANGALVGFASLAAAVAAISLALPLLSIGILARVKAREAAAPAPQPA